MKQREQRSKKFVQKLSDILNNPAFQNIIRMKKKDSFIEILDQKLFVERILPSYFKHNRLQSFSRLLNLYGFKKLRNTKFHIYFHQKLKQGAKIYEIQSIKQQKTLMKKRLRQDKKRLKQQNQGNQRNQTQQENVNPQVSTQEKFQQSQHSQSFRQIMTDNQHQNQWNSYETCMNSMYSFGLVYFYMPPNFYL